MAAEQDKPKTKRAYRRPTLTRFGDLRDLTRTSVTSGTRNDMTTGMNKSA